MVGAITRTLIVLLGLTVLAAGCGDAAQLARLMGQQRGASAAASPVAVQVAAVRRGPLANIVSYSGSMQAKRQVPWSQRWPGASRSSTLMSAAP